MDIRRYIYYILNKIILGNFRLPQDAVDRGDGINTTRNDENAYISTKHYPKVCNCNDGSLEFSVIEQLKPLCIDHETNERIAPLPSDDEVVEAIKRMRLGMDPGATGVTSNMLKAIPVDDRYYIVRVM
jgi:hypothetical protein